MSKLFKFQIEGAPQDIKSKLETLLVKEITKPYVKTSWKDCELIIKIEKMGSSEIHIQLKEENGKCSIIESKRSIALMHKAFIGEVENIVDNLLTKKLGATKI
jgi:hypothetical protein